MNYKALVKAVGTLVLMLTAVFVTVFLFVYTLLYTGGEEALSAMMTLAAFVMVVVVFFCFGMAVKVLYNYFNRH